MAEPALASEPADTPGAVLHRRAWTGAFALLCSGLALLVYLTPPSIFTGLDWLMLHAPYKAYAARALLHGRLPLWDPHVALGRPFMADIETAIFYPPGWLFVLLGPSAGLVLLVVLHSVLAAFGTAALARALGARRLAAAGAGLAFSFGAVSVGAFQLGNVQYGFGICWLPLVLFLAVRLQDAPSARHVLALTGALALQVLTGHQQIAWITAMGGATLLAFRRLGERPVLHALRACALDLLRLGACGGWALAVCAVQLLPFLELVGQGNRAAPSLEFSASLALTPSQWSFLVTPVSAESYEGDPFHTVGYFHPGVLVALLGAAGLARWRDRNGRALLAVSVLAILIAAGTTTPAFALLYRVMPGLSMFRIHSRMLVLLMLALPVAAALWLADRRRAGRAGALVMAAVAGWAAVVAMRQGRPALIAATLGALLLIVAGELLRRNGRQRAVVAVTVAAVALLAMNLAISTYRLKQRDHFPIDYSFEPGLAAQLRDRGVLQEGAPPPRISVPSVRPNAGLVHGWSTFAHWGFATDRVWRFEHLALGLEPSELDRNTPSSAVFKLAPLPYDSMNLVAGHRSGERVISFKRHPDPRAYVAPAGLLVRDWHEALAMMARHLDTGQAALVESPALAVGGAAGGRGGEARVVSFSPERVVLETESDGPGLLVVKEAWFPGWTATVNGLPATCGPANVWMRAVPVPAGRSRVELEYRSTHLVSGACLSVAALGAMALVFLRSRRGRRRQ